MKTRTPLLALVLVATVPALWLTTTGSPLLGQNEKADGSTFEPPQTPWGHPDLQGIWGNATITPFERPPDQENEFLTEEEVAAAEERRLTFLANSDEAGPPKTEAPPAGGNVGAYNMAWMDSGTRVVGTRRTSQVIDPPNGRVPVRPAALEKRAHALEHSGNHYEFMSVWDRCITRGIPGGMFPAGYNNYYRILQTPEYIVILYEMIHEARIIPLDGAPHPPSDVELWNGISRGRFEGNTLVVETRNFTDKGWIATSGSQRRIKGIEQTADAHVVERFTRVDGGTIDWRVTIEDPKIYTAPWTVAIPLVAEPDLRIYEYACHEGNQAIGNILRGARVEEAARDNSD